VNNNDAPNNSVRPDRPRVGLCITELDPGGAEKNLVRLAEGLHRRGWPVHVFCLAGPTELAERLRRNGVEVWCLEACCRLDLRVLLRLTRQLRRVRPQLLHTFLWHANLAGRVAAWLAGVPHVVSGVRVAEKDGPWRLAVDRWTNRLVDVNVCVSEGVRRFCVEQVRLLASKCVVIPNAVDVAEVDQAEPVDWTSLGVPAGSRVVLFVGRLALQKAPETLLEAAPHVLDRFDDVWFVLVGDGPLRRRLERLAARLPHGRRVRLLGWRRDAVRLMKAAYCLALPSRWEGMPNAVLEAMAAGVPVVATQVEGVTELVDDGRTGLTVPTDQPDRLAAALVQLLEQPELARRLADAGRRLVRTRYRVERMVSEHERLYEKLLAGGSQHT